MIKDDYREETNIDVYDENSQGSYSDDYVKWLETKLQLLQSRVVGQSEQLCQNKYDTIISKPVSYCQKCGWYHN